MSDTSGTSTSALGVIILTVFIDMLGVGILIPVVPQLLGNPRSPNYLLPDGWTYSQGLICLGFLIASYPLAQFVSTPILGQLSDRFGRRPVLIISLTGSALGYGVFAIGIITKNIPLLFISRTFDGITGGNISVAQAAVADISTPENRTKHFGLVGAMFGLGFILGPYIGGKLAVPDTTVLSAFGKQLFTTPHWFSAATPFWFAAILCLINVAALSLRLPETLHTKQHGLAIAWNRSLLNISDSLKIPRVKSVVPAVFLYGAGFTFFTTFFSLFITQKLGFRENNVGDYFAYIGIWIAITQAVIAGKLAAKFPDWKIIRVVLLLLPFAILLTFLPSNTTQLLLITPFIPICVGLGMANITSMMSRLAPPERQGQILGINASVNALAQAIPAALTGFLGGINRNVPILASSITIGLGAIAFWVMFKPDSADTATSGSDSPAPARSHSS